MERTMTTARLRPHERGTDRLNAFSDGVVAIAITLLILPLSETDVPEGVSAADVLSDNVSGLFAFALSFAVIGNYWSIHHSIFRPLRRHTPRLIQLNLLWLAGIVFLPFPTALIEDGVDDGFATLYIATLLVTSVLTLLLAKYLADHPGLTDPEDAGEVRRHVPGSVAAAAALLLALVIALFSQRLGMYALLLLVPAQLIGGRIARRRSGGPEPVPGPPPAAQ
jgi:uncharacterized membrane protein